MTRIFFKFIIYLSCERALKNGRVKSKIVRKSSSGDMIFLTSHDYIWLLFISFLYCAKKGIVVEVSKVSKPLEKSLPLCKGGRKCKNEFFNQFLLHLLFLRKKNSNFWKRLYQLFFAMVRLAALWMCEDIGIEHHTGHLLAFRKRL